MWYFLSMFHGESKSFSAFLDSLKPMLSQWSISIPTVHQNKQKTLRISVGFRGIEIKYWLKMDLKTFE